MEKTAKTKRPKYKFRSLVLNHFFLNKSLNNPAIKHIPIIKSAIHATNGPAIANNTTVITANNIITKNNANINNKKVTITLPPFHIINGFLCEKQRGSISASKS